MSSRRLAVSLIGVVALLWGGAMAAHASGVVLSGTFRMRGKITVAAHVRGEHRGQHVVRTWTFIPHCRGGGCRHITLRRRRARRAVNVITLSRRRPGLYVGRGRFWVPLGCAGHVDPRGGLALEKITVRVVRTQLVGTALVATAVRARYDNFERKNLTRCPGGIGHDAARYRGVLVGR